jgi:hypothetical protein
VDSDPASKPIESNLGRAVHQFWHLEKGVEEIRTGNVVSRRYQPGNLQSKEKQMIYTKPEVLDVRRAQENIMGTDKAIELEDHGTSQAGTPAAYESDE